MGPHGGFGNSAEPCAQTKYGSVEALPFAPKGGLSMTRQAHPNRSRSERNTENTNTDKEGPDKIVWQIRFQDLRELFRYLVLEPRELHFLDGLFRYGDKNDGRAWPSLGAIAEEAGISLRTAKRAKASLLKRTVFELKDKVGGGRVKIRLFEVIGRGPVVDGKAYRTLLYRVLWEPALRLLDKLRARKKNWGRRAAEEQAAALSDRKDRTAEVDAKEAESATVDEYEPVITEWRRRFAKSNGQIIDVAIAKARFSELVAGGMSRESAAKAAFDEPTQLVAPSDPPPRVPESRSPGVPESRSPSVDEQSPTKVDSSTQRPTWKQPRKANKKARAKMRKAKPNRPPAPKPSPELESYVRDLLESGQSPREAADHVRRLGLMREPEPESTHENAFSGALTGLKTNIALAAGFRPMLD
jgi:hypothetical protein